MAIWRSSKAFVVTTPQHRTKRSHRHHYIFVMSSARADVTFPYRAVIWAAVARERPWRQARVGPSAQPRNVGSPIQGGLPCSSTIGCPRLARSIIPKSRVTEELYELDWLVVLVTGGVATGKTVAVPPWFQTLAWLRGGV
jgi:hypothetical protein